MTPGEVLTESGEIELNAGRTTLAIRVANTGDRPIQVGSHYHFYETNTALDFERESTRGFRLNIPAGTSVRFEPGESKNIQLTEYTGKKIVYGFSGLVSGSLEKNKESALKKAAEQGFKNSVKKGDG